MKKKSVFETADFFFFWEGRCDGGCRYWIRGKEQKYHSSWLKRTKTLTRFIEVDFIITMMSGSYTFMSHLFSCKITACKATSHWRHNKLSARNVFKLVWQFLLSMHLDSAFFNTPRQWKCFVTCFRCHDIWPINSVTPHDSAASSRAVFLIPKISQIIRHCKFVLQGGCSFLKKLKRHVLFKLEQRTRRRKNLSLNRGFSQVGQ